jgi:TP901 family phage tail tape measure protein
VAERVVKVKLSAQVAEYVQGMETAAKKTRELGSESEKLAQKKEAFDVLGRSMLAVGTIAGVAVGLAVAKFVEFDQAMSNVQAATKESAENMDLLRNAALDAGARTVFSATEAANAIEELGKAGVSTQDILNGGLDGALDLAAAGGLGVAEAAGIAAVALKTFNLNGEDMSHVADLLAAGAGKAMGDVTDLSMALNQSALVAKAAGLTIEETTAGLSAFASAGLLGSDAGTSFKSMLQRLTPQSNEAKTKMAELGISAYDAQGQFIGLSKFAGNLQDSLKKLTPEQRNAALATIFGSDAVRAANVLYNEGADGIDKWTAAVDDQGYAAEQAATRLDNLAGDVEALGGAFDTALIKTGSGANDVLRTMVQVATSLIEAYGNLPAPVQGGVLAVGALVAVVGLAGGAFLLAVPKVVEFRTAIATLGVEMPKTAAAARGVMGVLGGPWGIAIGAAVAVLAAFGAAQADNAARVEAFAATLDASTGKITDSTRDMVKANLSAKQSFWFMESDSAYDAATKLGIGLDLVTDAASGNVKALEQLNDELQLGAAGSDKLKKQMEESGLTATELSNAYATVKGAVAGQSGSIEEAIRVAKQKQSVDEDAAGATEDQKQSLEELAGVANDTNQAISDLADEIKNFGSAQFDVEESTIALYDAFDSLKANLESGTASLDVTTEAGRQTGSALLDTAKAANDNAAAIAAVGGTTDQIAGALNAGRQRIIDARIALGDSAEAAQAYADKLIATPTAVQTQVTITGADAAVANLERVKSAMRDVIDLIGSMPVFGSTGTAQANGGVVDYYANGGMRENHVAQIAPAGSWRVWAEPETGGEAYIPLAPAKRARSLDIWQETGRRLGVDGYAGGGMYAANRYASSTAPPQTISMPPIYVQNPFTGEYLLAKVDGRISQADTAQRVTLENGLGR